MTKASLFYKRSYTNGYEQKVNYYLDRLDQEIQNEDVDQIKYCVRFGRNIGVLSIDRGRPNPNLAVPLTPY